MQFVKQEITKYIDTNLTDEFDEWSPTTTYIVEENNNLTNASVVRYGTYYYRSVTNDNLNFNPEEYENIKWVKYKVSNKFAMLDMSANSKSVVENGDMFVIFPQNYMEVLGFGNYEADTILVELLAEDMTTVVWSKETISLINLNVYDYWDYMYEPYIIDSNHTVKMNIPRLGKYVRVTFRQQPLNNRSACGYMIGGNPVYMGKALMGVSFSYNSFATKKIGSLGSLEIEKGAVQDIVDFETVISSNYLPRMRRELKKIYNEIGLFIVDEREDSQYENLMTLGVIQDASVLLENVVESVMTFSVLEAV